METDGEVHSEAESRRGDSGNLLRAGHPNTGWPGCRPAKRPRQILILAEARLHFWDSTATIRQPEKKLLLGCAAWDVAMETRERHLSFPPQVWQADGMECSMLLSCRSILHLSYSNYSMLLWPFLLSDSLFANTSQISQQERTRIAAVNLSTTITW